MVVVFDTSTVFSAIVFGGKPRRVLDFFLSSDEHEIAISPQMERELKEKLHQKAHNQADVLASCELYFAQCLLVKPAHHVRICRDPKDDMILDCAFAANASLMITSDRDLLALSQSPNIGPLQISNPSKAFKSFVEDSNLELS